MRRPSVLRSLDTHALRRAFETASPFPHVVIDDLLEPEFAAEIVAALPQFEGAESVGHRFETVNEHRKVQVTEASHLSEPLQRLLGALHGPEWLTALEAITGVPAIETDERLIGGGLHMTGRRGRLDVHADFNYLPDVERFRRLNLLLYLNPNWRSEWGGELELWDADMQRCEVRVEPVLGRCVIFATSTDSFHGTTRVTCPEGTARSSFALYYYSHVPPEGFADDFQGTVFKARPNEWIKGKVLMPLEVRLQALRQRLRRGSGDGPAPTDAPKY